VTPKQWERLKNVFQDALEQPAHARRAFIAERCADDVTVLREAEALLATHETAGTFLDEPARVDPADLETLVPGTVIGSYKVLDEIGRGGMGVVYLAKTRGWDEGSRSSRCRPRWPCIPICVSACGERRVPQQPSRIQRSPWCMRSKRWAITCSSPPSS
jgi:hypothetical protein